MRRIDHIGESDRAQRMWVAIQKREDKLSVFDILRLNGKVHMSLDLCLVARINPQTIQEYNSNSLLRQILLPNHIANLIVVLPLYDIVLGIGRNSKEDVASETDPVIIGNLGPLVGLVDEVDDHAGLEGLEHEQIEVDDR